MLQKHHRPHQSRFTHCRSTLDAILALCLLAEIHIEFQQPLHVAFVDSKAAFDSVDRNALWKAMHGVGVPSVLMNLIIDLRSATSARVRLAGRIYEPFTTTSGVRQGCVLATALFCRVMDYIMDCVSRIVGIQGGQLIFTHIDYADDIALLVDKEESFCTALAAMDEEASKFGLWVSWTKTKLQNLGSGSTPSPIIMDGNTVDSVKEFTYLGSIQSSSSNSGPEYIRRIGLAASAMKRLNCIWSQSKFSIATKLRIYYTCVLSVLLYGFETWTLTQADWKRLDSFHLRCQRRILHISWYDLVSDDEVLRHSDLFDVSYIVRKRRLGLWSRRQTSKWCTGKPDPPNLYQDEGRWLAFSGVETHQRSSAHHLDPPDLPWHRCYSDGGPGASGG